MEPICGQRMPPSPSPTIHITSVMFMNANTVDASIYVTQNAVDIMWMNVFVSSMQN